MHTPSVSCLDTLQNLPAQGLHMCAFSIPPVTSWILFFLFFKTFFFNADHFFKVFLEFVIVLLLFCVWGFWPREAGSYLPACFSHYVVPDSYDPMDCSLPGSSVHGILQASILKWVALSFSRGSFQTRNRTQVSYTAGRFFTNWAMREALTRDQTCTPWSRRWSLNHWATRDVPNLVL